MSNPIVINSANIIQFGLGITFDIGLNKITFDSSTLTTYQTGGAANVQGIYLQVFDASGLEVKTLDLTTPDILPATPAPYVLQLANGFAQYGLFIINAIIVDQDSTQYKIALNKNIYAPNNFENGAACGKFMEIVNCDAPKVILSETTNFTYQGLLPLSISKSGTLYYPQGTASPVAFTFTPFEITGSTAVYTGWYKVVNSTTVVYDLLDNVFVTFNFNTTQLFEVRCTSKLVDLICCIKDVENTYYSDPNSAVGRDAKAKLDKISVPFLLATIEEKAGKDNSAQIKIISDTLQCDCVCEAESVEPVLLTGDNAGPSFTITGQYGTSVTPTTVGGSTQYQVASKTTTLTKNVNELGFSITTTTTASNVNYAIAFNLPALAQEILTAIGDSPSLTDMLNNLINTSAGLSLNGLNGGCVITIGNCSYSLIELSTPVKTIVSITIAGTVYNAPSNLLLTNVSGVSTWLNGLALGTFTAIASGSNIVISSAANPNAITQFIFTTGGSSVTRQFTQTCVGLVQVLNAIINYVCTIDTTKITFGVTGQTVVVYSGDTGTPTSVPSTVALSTLLTQMLAAENKLFSDLNTLALTCANVQVLFPISSVAIVGTDYVLGTKGGICARLSFTDLATVLLSTITASPTLSTAFCTLVASCNSATCSPPSNVSGVLTTGPTCAAISNITGSVS